MGAGQGYVPAPAFKKSGRGHGGIMNYKETLEKLDAQKKGLEERLSSFFSAEIDGFEKETGIKVVGYNWGMEETNDLKKTKFHIKLDLTEWSE